MKTKPVNLKSEYLFNTELKQNIVNNNEIITLFTYLKKVNQMKYIFNKSSCLTITFAYRQ